MLYGLLNMGCKKMTEENVLKIVEKDKQLVKENEQLKQKINSALNELETIIYYNINNGTQNHISISELQSVVEILENNKKVK